MILRIILQKGEKGNILQVYVKQYKTLAQRQPIIYILAYIYHKPQKTEELCFEWAPKKIKYDMEET